MQKMLFFRSNFKAFLNGQPAYQLDPSGQRRRAGGGWRGAAALPSIKSALIQGEGAQSTQSNLTGRIKLSSRHSVLHQVSKTLLIFRIFLKLIIQLWAHLLKCPCRISDFQVQSGLYILLCSSVCQSDVSGGLLSTYRSSKRIFRCSRL